MRCVFRLPFCLAFFAALLTLSAHAEDDAVYSATYIGVPTEGPFKADHYRY